MALNHSAFKCPICHNSDKFAKEMQKFGVYLPQREASVSSWEALNEASNAVLKVKECGAKVCFCDKEEARKYSFSDGIWDLLDCYSCDSSAIHARCGGLEDYIDPQWHCYVCRRVVRDDLETARRQKRPINEVWGTALGKKPMPDTHVTIVQRPQR